MQQDFVVLSFTSFFPHMSERVHPLIALDSHFSLTPRLQQRTVSDFIEYLQPTAMCFLALETVRKLLKASLISTLLVVMPHIPIWI